MSLIPIYVTRKNGEGRIGTVALAPWKVVSVLWIALLNAVGWGIYGLVELVGKVVG